MSDQCDYQVRCSQHLSSCIWGPDASRNQRLKSFPGVGPAADGGPKSPHLPFGVTMAPPRWPQGLPPLGKPQNRRGVSETGEDAFHVPRLPHFG